MPVQPSPLPHAPHTLLTLPLYRLAHSRTGDKGNRSNISVIAWHPALWDTLVLQLTQDVVAQCFAQRQPSRVARYLVPSLHAMNFVLDDVLDGGVNDALNLDSHGKTLSYHLLDCPLQVPAALVPYLAGPPLASSAPGAHAFAAAGTSA